MYPYNRKSNHSPNLSTLGLMKDESTTLRRSLSDALATDGTLASLVPAFTLNGIEFCEDVADLSVTELQQICPDTPLGTLIRLRREAKRGHAWALRSQFRADLPPHEIHAPVEHFMNDGLKQNLMALQERTIVAASLFATISISMLFDAVETCSSGSDCSTLRSTNMLIHIVSSMLFILSVLAVSTHHASSCLPSETKSLKASFGTTGYLRFFQYLCGCLTTSSL